MARQAPSLSVHIGAIPLFQGLAPEYIDKLARIATEQEYEQNQIIFTEGEPGSGFYVSVEGRAKIFKLSSDGKEQILHVFGSLEPFGEVPVFEGGAYPASAVALEKCRVLFFPRTAFLGLIEKDPSLALNMLAVLSKRLRRFTNLVEGLSLKEVPGRLAAYLLHVADQQGGAAAVQLDVSRIQLASLLGTIPETLSRILGRMAQQGFIRATGRRAIQLLDIEGLAELASGERRLS